MRVTSIDDDIRKAFTKCIIANELGNVSPYKFSEADGVHRGKSGWSFGITQLDVNNNPYAILCLRDANFTSDEIDALKTQTVDDMSIMDAKLAASKTIIDMYDARQLNECLDQAMVLCTEIGCSFSKLETFIHIADYHNQFYMSRGGKLYRYLRDIPVPITPEDILIFKMQLPWGHKSPEDVNRRYLNIQHIMGGDHGI